MENYKKIVIDFEPISRRISIPDNKNIFEILSKFGIRIRSLCGGSGTCGKCKIFIEHGKKFMNDPTISERKILKDEDLEKGWRLACQTRISKNHLTLLEKQKMPQFRIFLPEDLLVEDFKILTSGMNKGVSILPAIKKFFIKVNKPFLDEPISDFERILSTINTQNLDIKENLITIDHEVLTILPDVLRKKEHEITLTFWNDREIINVEPGNTIENNFGIAFDIGTTTIVGYLINLNDGKIHAVASKLNPQTIYGEDVITRITHAKDKESGLSELNSGVVKALNDIILKTCSKAQISPSQIFEATIVGNSVMHHIFLGFNPVNIGLSPYVPIIQRNLDIKANKLNLKIFHNGNVHVAPIIAGFVGADTMGVIISSNIEKQEKITLIIDIGTNGEIVIGNRDFIATGSCAAGSALEGAHIQNGMRAAAGAIDTVKINPKNYQVQYTTIKNKPPIGLCGSGLIDAVAEMLKSKIITRSGRFNKEIVDQENFLRSEKNIEFIIANKNETSFDKDITISQSDIRQIQMAKGAFYSGTSIILKYLNREDENLDSQIKQIFLAGAFGNYINKNNAKFIGMIPDISSEKIFQIGNAAGIGAQHCLLNKDLRKKSMQLLKKIQYVEIATKKEFQREYAEAMYFPNLNLDLFPSLTEYSEIPKR